MEKLMEILEDIRPDVDFASEKRLIGDGILNSLDIITIVDEINDEFEIEIRPKNLTADNFNSAEAIWALIRQLQG